MWHISVYFCLKEVGLSPSLQQYLCAHVLLVSGGKRASLSDVLI